ncbi:MAG: hypothetical protein JNK81_00185 [Anaerolineales bacterium]|nr:hypothetical protein [Anaerolineales bacterium]
MTKDNNGTCRLCLQPSVLRNSHILPEFFYSDLYDKKHRAISVPSYAKEKTVQKGLREYLLCQECETKFSKYETYASSLIKKIRTSSIDKKDNFIDFIVDYKSFKLFQLSLLWRAGICSDKSYSQVILAKKHEEKIRYMLHKEDAGKYIDYGCWMVMYPDSQKIKRIIWSPSMVKIDGHNGYKFMTGNLMWYFFVSSHKPNADFQSSFLQETGLLKIWLDHQGEAIVYENMAKALNSRKVK